jgi:S1-C subfamily serine protease
MKNLFTLAFALLFTFSLTAQRGFLGIHSNHVSEEKAEALGFDNSSGSYVTNILDHSAAQKAGMQPFDYIYGLNDEETSDENDLTDLLGKYKPGEKVNVKMYRGGEKMSMAVVLGKESDGKSRKRTDKEDPFFGVSPIHEQLPKGVNGQPVAIVPNSTADEMGLQRGDILQAINGNPVLDWHDVGTAIDALQVGESIDVVYYRGKEANGGQSSYKVQLGYAQSGRSPSGRGERSRRWYGATRPPEPITSYRYLRYGSRYGAGYRGGSRRNERRIWC